jgi:hypothetical protein
VLRRTPVDPGSTGVGPGTEMCSVDRVSRVVMRPSRELDECRPLRRIGSGDPRALVGAAALGDCQQCWPECEQKPQLLAVELRGEE